MSRKLIPAALVVAAGVIASPAGAAVTPQPTTCTSSTPSTAAFAHTPTVPQVPAITSVNVTVDSKCNLTITDTITNRPSGLAAGESLTWYLNTDNNPSTGDRGLGGAEAAIVLASTSDTPSLVPWNPDLGRLDTTQTVPLTRSGFGFSANLAALSAMPGTIGMAAAASSSVNGTTYSEFIPGSSASGAQMVTFPVAFSAQAVAPTPTTPSRTCKVPRVVGKTLPAAERAIRAAHCGVGKVTKRKARHGATLVVKQQHVSGQRVSLVLGAKR